jgi:hypothetical protein
MQATARRLFVVAATCCARRRLIRDVRFKPAWHCGTGKKPRRLSHVRLPESAIPAVAFRFEGLHGRQVGPHELAQIREHNIEDVDPEMLAGELRFLIDSESKADGRDRAQAYWALGKKLDPALLPFFREKLRLELCRDMFAVYQILIALDDLGEQPFGSDRNGYSCHDYDLNRRDSEAYLDRVGALL